MLDIANSYYYTVVKSKNSYVKKTKSAFSFVVLNRGTKIFREDLLEFLCNFDFICEVISIEKQSNRNSVQAISENYEKLKFILLNEELSTGEKINIAMNEAKSDNVFVMWSDMALLNPFWIPNIFLDIEKYNSLCITGELYDYNEEVMPSFIMPVFNEKGRLETLSVVAEEDYQKNLYPIDYVGLYRREKFLSLSGFDAKIRDEYWQKLDFGFRAALWNEKIYSYKKLRIQYNIEKSPENINKSNVSYILFLLKNIVPLFKGNGVLFSFFRAFSVAKKYEINPFKFLMSFKKVASWVKKNNLRFRGDVRSVVELWEDDILS